MNTASLLIESVWLLEVFILATQFYLLSYIVLFVLSASQKKPQIELFKQMPNAVPSLHAYINHMLSQTITGL